MMFFNIVVIALSLTHGSPAAHKAPSHMTVEQTNGHEYVVTYSSEHSHYAPKRNAAHFAADEGNNGSMPVIEHKSL